jgi:hypothetical protein
VNEWHVIIFVPFRDRIPQIKCPIIMEARYV